MKRPVKILLILAGAALLLVLVVVANISRSRSTVRGVEVHLRYGKTTPLVEEATVRDSILAAIPALLQMQVADVDREQVAEAASHVPFLSEVNASVSASGKVVVRARQRRPIMRLYYADREYYLDGEGVVMPAATATGSCNVVVAGGNFAEPLRADSLNAQMLYLVALANYLDHEKRYGDLIDQIFIERDGDVLMVPKLGNHVVELGQVENLPDKFANLWAFYRKGMPRAGWDTYSKVSLKFKDQVVCTKRETK